MKNKDLSIGIIGGGVVGRATANAWAEHVREVRIYDIDPKRSTHMLHSTICDSDLIFVCLPTPEAKLRAADNSPEPGRLQAGAILDLSVIDEFFSHCGGLLHDKTFALRSTVPVGTTEALARKYQLTHLVHYPEFLTARCSLLNAQMPSRNIIGTTTRTRSLTTLWTACAERWVGTKIVTMTSEESEFTKLAQNAFFSVKVAFWNEMQRYAAHRGIAWHRVIDAILCDGRIHPSHTKVPGPDGRYGFGGGCLEKDLRCLIELIDTELGLDQLSSGQVDKILAVNPRKANQSSVCTAAWLRNAVIDRPRSAGER